MIGLEYWGSLATYLRTNEAIGDEYLACHFREIQQGSGNDELGNVYSLPGASRLAGGPANVKSDIVPLLRMLQLGSFCPVATSLAAGKWARAIYFVFVSVIYLLALPACACLSHANSSNFAAGQQRGFPFSSYRPPPPLPPRSWTSPDSLNKLWRLSNPKPRNMIRGRVALGRLAAVSKFLVAFLR